MGSGQLLHMTASCVPKTITVVLVLFLSEESWPCFEETVCYQLYVIWL